MPRGSRGHDGSLGSGREQAPRWVIGWCLVLASGCSDSSPATSGEIPSPVGPPREVAAHDGWRLVAQDSEFGPCLELSANGESGFGCGFEVPDRHLVGYFAPMLGNDRFVAGPVVDEAATVRVELLDGAAVETETIGTSLGTNVYVLRVRSGRTKRVIAPLARRYRGRRRRHAGGSMGALSSRGGDMRVQAVGGLAALAVFTGGFAASTPPAAANHGVLVEGNCDSPVPGTTLVSPGTCGDFDGDGRISTAEDTDGADRIFGTISAALGPGTGAAAGTGANNNGRITIIGSGRFAEALVITAANGNVTIEASPGADVVLDAVLSGDPAGGNPTRQNGTGIVVDAPSASRVTLRGFAVRNYAIGIDILGDSHVTLDELNSRTTSTTASACAATLGRR